MKITVNKLVSEEVDLPLPAYRKGTCHYFKILSDKIAIQVSDTHDWSNVSITATSIAISSGEKESTAEEFNTKLAEVNKRIMDYVLSHEKKEEEEEEQDITDFINARIEGSEGDR